MTRTVPNDSSVSAFAGRELRVAVVGAGIAGLSAARQLSSAGHKVVVFEKSRSIAGRMSVRRRPPFSFDHGAQYFTVRDERFRKFVDSWIAAGIVGKWQGHVVRIGEGDAFVPSNTPRYVGIPGMNAVGKYLATDMDVVLETRVQKLSRDAGKWRLISDQGQDLRLFDYVVVALPAAQVSDLLLSANVADRWIDMCRFTPCWSVMLGFPAALPIEFDAASLKNTTLTWIARNNSKPQRLPGESWVLHATADWSAAYIESSPEEVTASLLAEFRWITGVNSANPVYRSAHRWRYAQPLLPIADRFISHLDDRLVICGDWCGGDRVESAFLSGLSAAQGVVENALIGANPAMKS